MTEADETIASQVSEVQKLTHIINEADAERSRMKKVALAACWTVRFCNGLLQEYDQVINERDILGTQVHVCGFAALQKRNTCLLHCKNVTLACFNAKT